ncbi:hypothetical protein GCM10010123_20540 [Pilimelia anulata]|uniref:Uncharacterized protein n=1 Tax=Pilimelia anulata TaxID=53371 RepID=A0A8J3B557_9ACTN|nr:hypothetical protein GCM10010123_20540 [Pilimelia anulata]
MGASAGDGAGGPEYDLAQRRYTRVVNHRVILAGVPQRSSAPRERASWRLANAGAGYERMQVAALR